MKPHLISVLLGLILSLFVPTAAAQTAVTQVVYINGILNTLEEAQITKQTIQSRLDSSPNHPIGVRLLFSVDLVWNPVGWYAPPIESKSKWSELEYKLSQLPQDLMELFLQKTAEENFAQYFTRLLAPHNQPTVIDSAAALEVVKFLDDMTPGGNSLESNGQMDDEKMSATQRATRNLINYIKQVGSVVVVAHSQGNLLANLAWAKLVSEFGNNAKGMMRLVNVANTSQFSVSGLNFTHDKDAALFSDAIAFSLPDSSLQRMPAAKLWRRTTARCVDAFCDFLLAPATFSAPTTNIPGQGFVDESLDHSIVETYLSTATVPVLDAQGVIFTEGKEKFVDRFEDFMYAAAKSIAPSVTSLSCSNVVVGEFLSCEAIGENLPNRMVLIAIGCSNIVEFSGGTSTRRTFGCEPSSAGTLTVSLAGPGSTPIYRTIQVIVGAGSQPATAPTITDGPHDTSTIEGGSASFSVTATTMELVGLRYQWRLGALALTDGQPSFICGMVAGATTATLALTKVPLACSGSKFLVEVSGSPGLMATSRQASLTVTPSSTLTPAVSGVNPTAMVANGIEQTLTIFGSGFTSGNIVQFRWGVGTGAGVWNNSASPISSLTASQIVVPMNPGIVTDTIYVRVCASSSQTSTIDCSSGTAAISVAPVVSGSPDLVVQSVSFGPSAVQPGATVQVLFAVKNQGTGTAGASTAAIRINQSGTSSIGTTAGTASVPSLTAGASTAVQSINVFAPTTPGLYSVWVVADSSATAGQKSGATANDSLLASSPLTVNSITTGPVVSSVTSSPQTLVVGGPATFSINGTELQLGYLFSLAGCNATEVGSASTTLRQFTCTLTQAGTNLAGSVSTASGTVLWTFSQSVAANPVASGPGGLYVGYYAEDTVANPEDPTIGGLFFSLPATNGNFAGAMFFTFASCQTSNVGALSGTKDASGMIGAWSGVVDGILQSGSYGGAYGSALGAYLGTYTVSGGKQLISVPGCIQYYVSPHGTWEAMPVGSSVPSTFTLAVSGTSVSWINPVGTIITWVSVIDAAEASAGIATAVKYQTGSAGGAPTFNLGAVSGLTSGRTYVVTVTTATSNSQRTGVASVQVVR